MNDGTNGLMGSVLIVAPVIFAEKEVDLKGKSPWVGLCRTIWFQVLVPEPGGFACPVLPSDAQPLYTTAQHPSAWKKSWGKLFRVISAVSCT